MITPKDVLEAATSDRTEILTPVQKAVLENYPFTDSQVIYSPTGTGKTMAFLLPLLMDLHLGKVGFPVLVVSPTRELAIQLKDVFSSLNTGLQVVLLQGGKPIEKDKLRLQNDPHIIIGTPGRLADHVRRGTLYWNEVEYLIFDEFDKTLEMGFQEEIREIVEALSAKRQLFASATKIDEFPTFLNLGEYQELDFLEEKLKKEGFVLTTDTEQKPESLVEILKATNGRTLVFCNHRETCDRLQEMLADLGIDSMSFHGGLDQDVRERRMMFFRNGTVDILVCTDLASRGLDIDQIKNVVHYQWPQKEEDMIHRNGRVGRMNQVGHIFYLLTDDEDRDVPSDTQPFSKFKKVKREVSVWDTLYISGGKRDKLRKTDVLGFLIQKGGLAMEEVGNILVSDTKIFVAIHKHKIASLLGVIRDEKIKGKKYKTATAQRE